LKARYWLRGGERTGATQVGTTTELVTNWAQKRMGGGQVLTGAQIRNSKEGESEKTQRVVRGAGPDNLLGRVFPCPHLRGDGGKGSEEAIRRKGG